MKKLILISFILLITGITNINAQVIRGQRDHIENLPNFDKKTLRFGFYLGMNNNSYKISYIPQENLWPDPPYTNKPKDLFVSVDASLGFNLGFVIDYRLHKNISLRFEPGLMSNTKTLSFFLDPDFYNGNVDLEIDPISKPDGTLAYPHIKSPDHRDISSTYIHLPLLLKFSTNRYKNIRPYIIGGASYDYNFINNETNPKDNYEGTVRMTSSNFMYEIGIGMDFYFYYFKFSPSIRGIFAINNEMVRDNPNTYKFTDPQGNDRVINYPSPWTGPIDYFGTRGVYLNLTFQ